MTLDTQNLKRAIEMHNSVKSGVSALKKSPGIQDSNRGFGFGFDFDDFDFDDFDSDSDGDGSEIALAAIMVAAIVVAGSAIATSIYDSDQETYAKYGKTLTEAFSRVAPSIKNLHSKGENIPSSLALEVCTAKEKIKKDFQEQESFFAKVLRFFSEEQSCEDRVEQKGAEAVFYSAFVFQQSGIKPPNLFGRAGL